MVRLSFYIRQINNVLREELEEKPIVAKNATPKKMAESCLKI